MEQRKLGLATYRQVFWRYLRPHIGRVALLAVVLLSSIGLQLIRPQIVRGFIDQAQQQAALERLIWAAAAYLVLGLVAQGADLLAMYLSTDLGFAATNTMREDLTAHCLRLSMAFHNDRTPGEMIERIDGDVTALSNFFSQFVIRLLGSALLIIGVLIALYLEDWRVGVALTLFVVVSFVVLMSMRDAAVKESEQEREASAEMYGFLEERLEGLDDIRANGASRYTMNRFHERIREYYQAGLRAFRARTVIWRTAMFVFGQGQVLALLVAALLYTQGFITIGTIYLLYAYTGMLLDPLEQIVHQIQDLQKAAAGIQRTTELLMRDDRVPDGERNDVPSGALDLTFDGVHFGYEDDEPVLQGVSFDLKPGTKLGLLGRTGCGKTTLTRLIFRLYDPRSGQIRLDGQPVDQFQLQTLRQRIAMVTQEVQLFRASVRDNLTFFAPAASDEQIIETVRELGLGDWYDRLPDGLDTELAPGGGGLSAGEAQLLAFARAFLGDPGLVVLDEPSSRLDPATEHLLEQAMDRLLRGRTGIIIAHRLATVQRVDEIMIMNQGRVQEYGARDELVQNPSSLFSQLLKTGLEEAFA